MKVTFLNPFLGTTAVPYFPSTILLHEHFVQNRNLSKIRISLSDVCHGASDAPAPIFPSTPLPSISKSHRASGWALPLNLKKSQRHDLNAEFMSSIVLKTHFDILARLMLPLNISSGSQITIARKFGDYIFNTNIRFWSVKHMTHQVLVSTDIFGSNRVPQKGNKFQYGWLSERWFW